MNSKKIELMFAVVSAIILFGVFWVTIIGPRTQSQDSAIPIKLADAKIPLMGSRLIQGQAGSNLAVVEFSDYECPPCRFHRKPIEEIVRGFQGKVSLYLQSFPLTMHKHAKPLTLIGSAIGDAQFREFSEAAYSLEAEHLNELILKWESKLSAKGNQWKTDSLLNLELTERAALLCGVTGTPTIFVVNQKSGEVWRTPPGPALSSLLAGQLAKS